MNLDRLTKILIEDIKESLEDNKLNLQELYGEEANYNIKEYELHLSININGEDKGIVLNSPLGAILEDENN